MQRSNASGIKYSTRFFPLTNEDNMIYYEKTENYQYTAGGDGESVIVLPSLIGFRIIQVEREIKPLNTVDYSFNSSSGQLNLLNGVELSYGESLYILYAKIITS